jgi:conjugal transfer ATP-binding protein TraC
MTKRNRLFSEFKEFQAEHSLVRELPYWDFLGGIVTLSDGSLALGLRLNGAAVETWDACRINRLTHDLRAFLSGLTDGLGLSFVTRVNSDYASMIEAHDSLSGDIPNIRWLTGARAASLKEQMDCGSLSRTSLYLFLYQRFQGKKNTSFLSSLFSSPKQFQAVRREEHEKAARELRQTAESCQSVLASAGIGVEPLSESETWKLAYEFLNPSRSQVVSAPKPSHSHRTQEFQPEERTIVPELALQSPREQLVFSDLIQGAESFFFDGYYHRILTLKTLPEETHAAMMAAYAQLPFHYWLDVHVRVPEQSKELSSLQQKRRMAHSMSASSGGRATDLESEAQLNSTEELLRELINTGQKIFYFQMALLLRAKTEDQLTTMTKTALQKFRELSGAEGLAETVAGFKVFKTMLPFGNVASVRGKRVKTENLADFLPVYEPYSGRGVKPVCLFHNRSSGLVAYDPFDTTRLPSFNALFTGSSGAGKSFLNNIIMTQAMTQKPIVFVIDIGGSYKKICEFMGGQYIEIGPAGDGETRKVINPFELPGEECEPSSPKVKFLVSLLECMFTDDDGQKLPKLSRSLLEEAVLETYKTVQSNGARVPLLSDLRKTLEASKERELQNFAKMLYPWTGERAYGQLLDRANELDLKSDFVVFDLKGLSSYPDLQAVMTLIITDFIVGKVESKSPRYYGRKKRIYMDECWELLKGPAAYAMEYWVRTLRKALGGITFVTQGLEEIVAHPVGPAILGNTPTKVILLQRGDLEPVRRALKLNEQEMALISTLQQQKGVFSEAYMIANEDRSVIRVYPTPLEYWLATSDRDDNTVYEQYRTENPNKSITEVIYDLATRYPHGAALSAIERKEDP